ncbi:hypothetical protein G7046_g5317 [Stylonectria norvegica]|nr:hypothetical protein G7046_g5317 [Stylonectria norvegica]
MFSWVSLLFKKREDHKREDWEDWEVQPGVFFHSSVFDPPSVSRQLDPIIGEGQYRFESGELSDRIKLRVKNLLSDDQLRRVKLVAAGIP